MKLGSGGVDRSKQGAALSGWPHVIYDVEETQTVDPFEKKLLDRQSLRDVGLLSPTITLGQATEALPKKDHPVTLTYKGLTKNAKSATYGGLAVVVYFPLSAFLNKTAPLTIEVADGVFAPAKTKEAKPKLTAEERKALRANKPKPTVAEKIAAAEARIAKMKARLQPEL